MRVRLPLWIHQLVEYLLAVLIVTQSINAGKASTFMAVTGGLLFLLAATTDASMGGLRWIPPQVHRMLDLVVIGALVAAPIVSGSTDPIAWALCLLAAAAVAWLNWHTQWRRAPRRPVPAEGSASEPATRPAPTSPAPSAPTDTPPAPPTPAAPSKAASLGDSARNLGKTVDRTTRGASRAAGRIYGRARAQQTDKGEEPEAKT
jgi:hypothetical protein